AIPIASGASTDDIAQAQRLAMGAFHLPPAVLPHPPGVAGIPAGAAGFHRHRTGTGADLPYPLAPGAGHPQFPVGAGGPVLPYPGHSVDRRARDRGAALEAGPASDARPAQRHDVVLPDGLADHLFPAAAA